jgi:putative SOS response-associated peptidase YedK
MPVILTADEWETWLGAPTPVALELQRPLPAGQLSVVATGQRQDAAA